MGKDWRQQIYHNVVHCLTLTLVDCHCKCYSHMNMNTRLSTLFLVMIFVSMTCWPNPLIINTLRPSMPFLDNDTCTEGGLFIFCQDFFPCMMPSMDGWWDEWMDGWKKLHEKRPRHPLLYVIKVGQKKHLTSVLLFWGSAQCFKTNSDSAN
jgi:hypothetical protein